MLLLVARSEIDPPREDPFNRWYDVHIPVLLKAPAGYENGRRYVARTPGVRHAALYEIRSRADLPLLYGENSALRDPAIAAEWAVWEKEFRPYMSVSEINIYDSGDDAFLPLLSGDYPIVLAQVAPSSARDAAKLNEAWNTGLGNALARLDDVVSASLLELSLDPVLEWLQMGPSHLILIQCAGVDSAREFVHGGLSAALDGTLSGMAVEYESTAYSQVARWWRWPDDAAKGADVVKEVLQ
jgi:hypothetical protein